MSQFQLCSILLRMIPEDWWLRFQAINPNYAAANMSELVLKLEGVEREKLAEKKRATTTSTRNVQYNNLPKSNDGGGKSSSSRKRSRKRKAHKYFCSYCKKNNKAYWTHNTSDCMYKNSSAKESVKHAHAMKKLKSSHEKMEKRMAKLNKKSRNTKPSPIPDRKANRMMGRRTRLVST